MSKTLFLAWQHPETRSWATFARLDKSATDYDLTFTRGASGLRAVHELFKMDPHQRYRFSELLPIFKNRLPSRSRTDFSKMTSWLNLRGDEDEFALLSRFGLIPGTDGILVYPQPDVRLGHYSLEFFLHGLRHMHGDVEATCAKLEPGNRLLPLLDVQNPVDQNAVALRPEHKTILLGYVPAFYAEDVRSLVSNAADGARITVVRCNPEAPTQLRLLCRLEAPVAADFVPLQTEAHKSLLPRAA